MEGICTHRCPSPRRFASGRLEKDRHGHPPDRLAVPAQACGPPPPLASVRVDPGTTAWLEASARRVVDAQVAEVTRINSRARELVGFVGIILGLLATTASQSGGADGLAGGCFRVLAIVAVAALLWSATHVVQKIVLGRPELRDIGAGTLDSYLNDPALAELAPEEVQARAFYDLTAAAADNAELVERTHADFAAGYGAFAIGLFAAGLAIVALVLALI